jgi:hypothetical protein
MRLLTLFLTLLHFSVVCLAGDSSGLLGRWEFHSSSNEIPKKCKNSYLDFVGISRIVGSDGSRKGELEYSVEDIKLGFNLITR